MEADAGGRAARSALLDQWREQYAEIVQFLDNPEHIIHREKWARMCGGRDALKRCIDELEAAGLAAGDRPPTLIRCRHCGEEIRLAGGVWLDCETHSTCEQTEGSLGHAPRHEPAVAAGDRPSLDPQYRSLGNVEECFRRFVGGRVTEYFMEDASHCLRFEDGWVLVFLSNGTFGAESQSAWAAHLAERERVASYQSTDAVGARPAPQEPDLRAALLHYRQRLRTALYRAGVVAHPAAEDDWMLDRVVELLCAFPVSSTAKEELGAWLGRVADKIEQHPRIADLFTQEIAGLRRWADKVTGSRPVSSPASVSPVASAFRQQNAIQLGSALPALELDTSDSKRPWYTWTCSKCGWFMSYTTPPDPKWPFVCPEIEAHIQRHKE